MASSLYGKALESRIFNTQSEARDWADKQQMDYKTAGISTKFDLIPADATRRRWKATLYQKI